MTEVTFWNVLKKWVPGQSQRIENVVGTGTPDVTAAYKGLDYWIELKVCANKSKEKDISTLPDESQLLWHYLRKKQGSIIFVAVQYSWGVLIYEQTEKYAVYNKVIEVRKEKNILNWGLLYNQLETILTNKGKEKWQKYS